ncbi:MAG: DmsE family decaheme c-type cytochrome [Candidatus Schekmanbacteria bacterium]|nr:DmsE family decaheme c-type cytochrome [Candidatus Schekmanbacteria bacterium]
MGFRSTAIVGTIALVHLFTMSAATAADDEYAGDKSCLECHEAEYNSYQRSQHAVTADPRTPASEHGCESCHGPSKKHADNDGELNVGGLVGFGERAAASAETKSSMCINCHSSSAKLAMWPGSTHMGNGVTCSNCHNPHTDNPKSLKYETAEEVCSGCHANVGFDFQRVSHHPVPEGQIGCNDCHNPHGTSNDKLLVGTTTNETCYTCHADKRGPFLWDHSPVTEACTTCHTPHGSSHDQLLAEKAPLLCQRCHSNSRHPGTLYALNADTTANDSVYVSLNNRAIYRGCVNCHSAIHGSNHPSGKTLAR